MNSSKKAFPETAANLRLTKLDEPLRKALGADTKFTHRGKITLSGGAPWAMITYTHVANREYRVAVKTSDIAEYAAVLRSSKPAEVRAKCLDAISDPQIKADAAKDFDDVAHVFTAKSQNHDILIAGAEILLSLAKELEFDKKEVVFFRGGLSAILVGYVGDKSGMDRVK